MDGLIKHIKEQQEDGCGIQGMLAYLHGWFGMEIRCDPKTYSSEDIDNMLKAILETEA